MTALRKKIGKKDVSDIIITDALSKGPKPVKIASREERTKDWDKKIQNWKFVPNGRIQAKWYKPLGYTLKAGLY